MREIGAIFGSLSAMALAPNTVAQIIVALGTTVAVVIIALGYRRAADGKYYTGLGDALKGAAELEKAKSSVSGTKPSSSLSSR